MKAIGNESLDQWDNLERGCPFDFKRQKFKYKT
jgi:hypothetical protein